MMLISIIDRKEKNHTKKRGVYYDGNKKAATAEADDEQCEKGNARCL